MKLHNTSNAEWAEIEGITGATGGNANWADSVEAEDDATDRPNAECRVTPNQSQSMRNQEEG